jgi:hypothetical protein
MTLKKDSEQYKNLLKWSKTIRYKLISKSQRLITALGISRKRQHPKVQISRLNTTTKNN